MPFYDFKCAPCSEKSGENVVFTVQQSMLEDKKAVCPSCGLETRKQIYSPPAVHEGMTAGQKNLSGDVKGKIEKGKFLRNEREKRKRDYGSGTREGDSNELWAGSHVPKGIISSDKMNPTVKRVGAAPAV